MMKQMELTQRAIADVEYKVAPTSSFYQHFLLTYPKAMRKIRKKKKEKEKRTRKNRRVRAGYAKSQRKGSEEVEAH